METTVNFVIFMRNFQFTDGPKLDCHHKQYTVSFTAKQIAVLEMGIFDTFR